MAEWHAATLDEVNQILHANLHTCDSEQRDAFAKYKVTPYRETLTRYGRREQVYVVAIRGEEVIYWEDVEEGFNVSRIASDQSLSDHHCNQDSLGLALNFWIDGRSHAPNVNAATSLPLPEE